VSHLSGKSGESDISVNQSIGAKLDVDTLPLIVHVLLVIHITTYHWVANIDSQKDGHSWHNKSDPVGRQTNIDHAVALKRAESLPQTSVVWLSAEGGLLLAQAIDVQIQMGS